jgi:hypothetical protein
MRNVRSAVTIVGVAAFALAGCGSSGGSTATSPASAAKTPSSSASPASSSSSSGAMRVDLEIQADTMLTIKGTKGTCAIGANGNSYSFTGADYPELGPGGAFGLTIGTKLGDRVEPPFIKLVIGESGYLSGANVAGIQSNPEGTVVNLDQGVSGSTAGGPMKTALVRGTIHCG